MEFLRVTLKPFCHDRIKVVLGALKGNLFVGFLENEVDGLLLAAVEKIQKSI